MNGLYIATIFVGGSIGSSLGVWAYARGGWADASWIGALLPVMALAYFLTEENQAPGLASGSATAVRH
jgi:predicted MFS family arabinose efflux permease